MGALKEEEKRFSRAEICFSGFNMACCLFWVDVFFSLLHKQYCLIEGVYTRDSQRTEFGLKMFTWP